MKYYKRTIILWLTLCIISLSAWAETNFRIIDYHTGLNSGTINHINFDSYGFAWLSTPDGLTRYDGVDFNTYNYSANRPQTICSNDIHLTLPEKYGIWIGAGTSLQYYDYKTGIFEQQQYINKKGKLLPINNERIQSIIREGDTIFAVDFLGKLYAKKDNELFFSVIQEGIYYLCHYTNHQLIALHKKGLYILSSDGKKIIGKYPCRFPSISWHSFLYYSANNQLLYYGNGLGYPSFAFKIQGLHINSVKVQVQPSNLTDVIDFQGGVAFGVDGSGIIIQKKNKIEIYNTQNSNLSNDAIYSLQVSPQNTLWVGTYRGGLNILNPTHHQFTMLTRSQGDLPYDIVTAVLPFGDNIYMGLDGGGLCIYNKQQHQSHTLTTANSNLPDNHIIGLLHDKDKLWLAVYTKGLVEYDLNSHTFTQYDIPHKSYTGNDIWTICQDNDKNIWVGGYNLLVFNPRTHQFTTNKTFLGLDCSSILYQGNRIWVGTHDKGIFCIDKNTQQILAHYHSSSSKNYIPNNQIRSIYFDHLGKLWLATLRNGLYTLDTDTHQIVHYDEKQGLTELQVASICEDAKGNLWIGTLNGLFRFHPATNSFMRLGIDESLSTSFTYGTNIQKDGFIYMGTTQGLLFFNPNNIKTRLDFNKVSMSALTILGGEQTQFNLYGTEGKVLKLAHDQNFFTISFSVPEYDSPHRIYFSCRLNGLESEWHDLGNKREVSYTNVPAGNYEFEVRCTGENGEWLKPTVLRLHISPPWYATWWAYSLWIIIFICIVSYIVWTYLHELDIKHKMQIVQVERNTMKKLNEAKMDFYARATHELRTPVFLISAQIEELMNMPHPVTVPLSFLHSLSSNSKKLNALISRVIDIRKLDKIKDSLNLQKQDVITFCEKLSEDYKDLCNQKHISFHLQTKGQPIMLEFDPDKLETIITNLVSNAFKYTHVGGKVSLSIQEETEHVVFTVIDNGIGIQENMISSIFENYFRTKRGEKQSEGDGIGLATVKHLIKMHHGDIQVESKVNQGSKFTFFIPKGLKEETMPETRKKSQELPVITNPTATHSILIIDDEHDTVDILERNLRDEFKVFKAYDGKEGLEIAAKELPDIIVTDLMMPNIDGMQFLRTLKEDKKLQHIKVIIFTAKNAEEDMYEAFDNGADAYLSKPISLRLLRKRIERLIAQGDNAQITANITNNKNTYNKEEQIFLLRCREIIEDNLQNEDFNVDFIADSMAMSHSLLYKKIKGITGMSLIDFINDYKIYKAVEMFRQGATNVDTVRAQCGFKDAKNFRTIFKRKKGVTPKQFIQKLYE